MKVLILHQHFNTPYDGGAIRSYYLAKALVDSGIETFVITGTNHASRKSVVDGIQVHALHVPYNNGFGFIKRSISFIRYMNAAVAEAGKIPSIDICYAISVPLTVGVAAIRLKKRMGIPFIFEVGDLWPAAPIELGFIKNMWLKRYLRNVERRIYNEANSVVALSTAIAEGVAAVSTVKVHIIENFADTDFYRPETKDVLLVEKFRSSGKFVVSYVGALGFANGLDSFLDAAKSCHDLPVQFILCGDGAMRHHLSSRISNENINNVLILPFTNRDGVKALFNVTDAAFISYLPYKILETGSPNKYFDALAAGKLIFTNFGGWIGREIEVSDIGFSYSGDPQQFRMKLAEWLARPERQSVARARARKLAEQKYSRQILSDKFVDLVKASINHP